MNILKQSDPTLLKTRSPYLFDKLTKILDSFKSVIVNEQLYQMNPSDTLSDNAFNLNKKVNDFNGIFMKKPVVLI